MIELTPGEPREGVVGIGMADQPVMDCSGLLDAWLTTPQTAPDQCPWCSGWPMPFLDEGSVEFGPGAEPSP